MGLGTDSDLQYQHKYDDHYRLDIVYCNYTNLPSLTESSVDSIGDRQGFRGLLHLSHGLHEHAFGNGFRGSAYQNFLNELGHPFRRGHLTGNIMSGIALLLLIAASAECGGVVQSSHELMSSEGGAGVASSSEQRSVAATAAKTDGVIQRSVAVSPIEGSESRAAALASSASKLTEMNPTGTPGTPPSPIQRSTQPFKADCQ